MDNLSNLKRQHIEIVELINIIKDLSKNEENINEGIEIAKNINILAGKLTVHLNSEDKYLYPDLLKSSDLKIKKIGEDYIKEMGNICDEFTKFKNKYNTKSKLLKNKEEFKSELEITFKLLEKRIDKEDRELYKLIWSES